MPENRNTQWYPYDQLGPMYVHTNYQSFKSNIGSFGDHGTMLHHQLEIALKQQEERENKIDAIMKETFGRGLDDFINFIKSWFETYREQTREAWISDEIKGRMKYGGSITALYSPNLQEGLAITQQTVDSIVDVLEKVTEAGYINMENFESIIQELDNILKNIESQIGSRVGSAKEAGIENALRGSIFALKGMVWEGFISAVIASFFKEIDAAKGFTLVSTGTMAGAKADDLIQFGNKANLGISIKSTRRQVFKEHGIYVHHGTLKSILELIENFSPLASSAVRDAKYYLINVSRMLAHPMTAQSGSGGIAQLPEGKRLISDLMSTYMTVFIGGTHSPDQGGVSEAVKQADILITQDQAIRKSRIIRGLLNGEDFAGYLKPNYSHKSSGYWESFDQIKRGNLKVNRGNYGNNDLLSIVRPEAERLLAQSASIRLRLLMK
jgi:hypothetical protein